MEAYDIINTRTNQKYVDVHYKRFFVIHRLVSRKIATENVQSYRYAV